MSDAQRRGQVRRGQFRRGAYPGSFNPPTVAHVGIADAARVRHGLDRVDLVVSRIALAKEGVVHPTFEERIEVLERVTARLDWLAVVVSEEQLIADLAEGYDVVIMGADKWHQLHDVGFYGGSSDARNAALARLPVCSVAPRPPLDVPDHVALEIDLAFAAVSSTMARAGAAHLMVPEALASGLWT